MSFATDILPILTVECGGCHSPGGIADVAGIELQLTANEAFNRAVGQPSVQDPSLTIIVPGDSASSLLFLKISSNTPPVGIRMPQSAPPLSANEITLIQTWIDQGALNN